MAKAAGAQHSQQGAPNPGLMLEIKGQGPFQTLATDKFQFHICLQAPSRAGPQLYLFAEPLPTLPPPPGHPPGAQDVAVDLPSLKVRGSGSSLLAPQQGLPSGPLDGGVPPLPLRDGRGRPPSSCAGRQAVRQEMPICGRRLRKLFLKQQLPERGTNHHALQRLSHMENQGPTQ